MPTVKIDYFGMSGSGRTLTEAKRDAGAKIESALSGDYSPVLVHWRGSLAVMARDPHMGWGYRLSRAAPDSGCEGMFLSNGNFASRSDCLRALLIHVADNEQREGETEANALFDSASGLSTSDRRWLVREFAERCARSDLHRRRRRLALSVGIAESSLHDFVLRNPACRELWEPFEHMEGAN